MNAYKITYIPWKSYPNVKDEKVVTAKTIKEAAEKIDDKFCISIELIGEFID